eukprot:TRINITY_DN5783_c1_g1_i3.p1 TRINITY_DN5783_c1_g1~~TRINITY_DN5783_c1_g1_i3.p1  ORF type:complete len:387 (-),score=37.53 TRINITY_DN5783_c1_g1_i3:573-1733(-)
MGGKCCTQTQLQESQRAKPPSLTKLFSKNIIPDIMKEEMQEHQNRYVLEKAIGSGGYGFVVLAFDNQTQQKVAIKFVEKLVFSIEEDEIRWKETKMRIQREILYHQMLTGHPNIIAFKELFLLPSYLCIVMEYATAGNLHSYVNQRFKHERFIKEKEARGWFQQIIQAIDRITALKIINRDIKLENILIQIQKNGALQLKLCDFGFAKHMERDSAPFSMVGSRAYIAPEVLFPHIYDKFDFTQRDIWSCGVTLFCILFGEYPFDQRKFQKPFDYYEALQKSAFNFPSHPTVSQSCRQLITQMLTADPNQRITLKQLMKTQWFTTNLNTQDQPVIDESVRKNLQSEDEIINLVDEAFTRPLQSHNSQEWMDDLDQLDEFRLSGELSS